MKAEIVAIKTIYNEDYTINCYEIIVDTITRPNLKLGSCKIIQ